MRQIIINFRASFEYSLEKLAAREAADGDFIRATPLYEFRVVRPGVDAFEGFVITASECRQAVDKWTCLIANHDQALLAAALEIVGNNLNPCQQKTWQEMFKGPVTICLDGKLYKPRAVIEVVDYMSEMANAGL